jgi:CheY-like chemotaxis protein
MPSSVRRVVLIDWSPTWAARHAGWLRGAGYEVETRAPRNGSELKPLQDRPPHAFVIDLGRLPSQGCAVAVFLRQRRATRGVPIVFADGEPEKVARVRGLLADAAYAEWRDIRGALRRAMTAPPARPLVPPTMAGYSGTPLPKKLGFRPGSLVALLGAPPGFEGKLGALPEGVRLQRRARPRPRVIVLFAKSLGDLARRFPAAARALSEGGALWIAWRKQASGVRTDLAERAVRALGLQAGFVDYKICAIDETWSGLCFARLRPPSRRRPVR